MLIDDPDDAWGGDETVDIGDLKSPERKLVWVRVPPALPVKYSDSRTCLVEVACVIE